MSEAADLLSGLRLGSGLLAGGGNQKLSSLDEMEFRFGGGLATHAQTRLDSDDDDDEVDPLRVHAQKEVPTK